MIQSKFILQSLVLIVAGVFATAQVYAQSQVQMNLLAHSDSVYTFAKAADSISKYLQSVNTNDTSEGGTLRAFSQWVRFSEQRVCNNAPQGANRLSVASKALVNYTKNFSSNCASNAQVWQGSWQCVGPYINSYGNHQEQSGRIDALWIHPTNANYILAGASSGGIWKTIDGGLSWYNITDASLNAVSGTTGINIIAVNPLHLDTMFAATGKVTGNKNNWGYSVGLIYTTNGGAHWQRDSNADTVVAKQNDFWDANIQQLVYLPGTTKLLLAYKDSIYIKHNLQDVWHNITPAFDSAKVTDIKFTNSNPSKALVKTSPRFGISKIWILDNGIWNQQIIDLDTNVIYQKYTEEENISLSLQDDVYLNIAKKTPGKLLVKHSLSSNTNTLLNTNMGNFQFIVVSPAHDSVFYATRHTGASGNDLLVSYNRGQSFNASISNNIHADVRYITVQKSFDTFRAVKDFVFAGTDGGIVCKKPYQTGFSSITGAGICVSQLYGFATTDQDEDIMEGGAQDNSSYSYIKSRTPQWVSGEIGGDNYLSEFQKNGRKVYSEYNFPYMGGIQFHVNNTSSPFSFSNPEDGKISAADQSGIRDPGTGYIYLWHPHAQDTRPLSLTETDAYVGYYHIWKKNIDSLNWQRVFAADPIMPILTDSLFDKRMIRDFIISEKDSVAYVAYKMPAYGNPVGTGNANGKLFFTNKLTPSLDGLTANWINITPAEVEWLRIMDIETDPNNLGRIWVALGEIDWGNITSSPQQMTNRIKYSNDYGQTWIDVSKGLPPLPVNKIIYQQGSDNILYAGTDAGVFKWNSANQEWECFNNGFPNCLVTDMEINYCAGKLRIATYGRGIWETSIMESAPTSGNPQVGNVTPIPTETITTNTTWTSDKYITTGIHITNNATLTISGTTTTIHMPNNGAIVVEPGTTLIVDGAKITNDCHGFWLGIEALGNSNQPQNGTTQATVLMYNGATIEHARFAIANWNHQSLANTGAIINVNGCHFINNHKSVELQLYHHLDANYNGNR